MVAYGDKIVVGVSGGADSVCLLFLLYGFIEKYALQLYAVHVHHGIREEAGEDAAFVEKLCKKWKIPCEVVKADVPALAKTWKMSEEEAGRRVRYEAFAKTAYERGCGKIAVAHNRNDEAETVLFHMFRGSGLHGLTGIPAMRKHGEATIIRPILCLERDEIEELLRDNDLSWVTDSTNLEDKYARNRIRHNILTEAESIAPGAIKHICEAAEQLAETERLLEELEEECLKNCRKAGDEIVLDVTRLNSYHTVIRKRAVLSCLKECCNGGKDIGALQVEQVLELADREGNRKVDLARGISAKRSYDEIVICIPQGDLQALNGKLTVEECAGDIEKILEIAKTSGTLNQYTKWLDYDKIDGQFELRTRKTGDYFTVVDSEGETHRKSLKDFMIDMKIPADDRDKIPVVACGSHCIWIVGYRISDICKLTPKTTKVVKLSYDMDNK